MDDLLCRETVVCFCGPPGGREMAIFGLEADPDEPPNHQEERQGNFVITYYFRGGGTLSDHTGEHRFGPGSVVLRVPGEQRVVHDAEPRYGKAYLNMMAPRGHALCGLDLLSTERTCWQVGDPAQALQFHAGIMRRGRARHRPRGAEVWVLATQWLRTLQPRRRIQDDALNQASEILRDDLRSDHDLAALAEEVGMRYHTFRRRFRERFGVGPAQWRLQQRMQQAGTLLADHSVQEVAQQLGYATPFAFSTQFSRSMGSSPRDWQRWVRRG